MVHTIHTQTHVHVHCNARSVPLNLFSAHDLAFYSIELLVCMFKRPLIVFSISDWDWAFVLVVCPLYSFMWLTTSLHACGAPLRLVLCKYYATGDSQHLSLRCVTMLSNLFSSFFMPCPLSFHFTCSGFRTCF